MEEAEALQLKCAAEAKYKESNFKSALKYAKRAHRLSPNLDGVSSMVTAFEILRTAHKNAPPNPPNWYKILQVEPFAHINTIKTKYKKLAFLLHPDKNPHLGSDEAFKLVGEAFRFLSDRIRRKEYDMMLRIKIQDRKMRESGGLGFGETFWTACSTCRLLHQFERRYLGHNLVCPSCKKSFEAVEVEGGDNAGVRSSERLRKMGGEGFRGSGVGGGNVEKEVSDGNGELRRRLRKRMSSVGEVMERCETKKAKVDEERMTLAELQLEIKQKAQEQKKKLMRKEKEKDAKKGKNSEVERRDVLKKGKTSEVERRTVLKKAKDLGSAKSRKSKGPKSEGLESTEEAEDSQFYNFKKDKRSFKKGQVWAIYDDDDGMPRNYGLVDEVVSVSPFEVKISWLDLQNNGDQWLASWEKMGLPVPCGRFKVTRQTTTNSVHIFSHVVDCDRAAREIYRIYPKKGSVWALYNEAAFDADGGNLLVKEKRCYDIVVFLTSYSEMHGLSMGYLEKVDGFNTVFKRREIGAHAIRCLEKDDVRLISHEIPAKKLSGNEVPNLSKDCWELDPASLPLDLLTFG
ncbi:uncharacterized protein LOC133742181 [Rosa rugosa]|uniref:uncharacterized protein LOC133742181 n=1 Tax=Rosa rugosa TaxID=74645 RepID=UPI002B41008C|nr:uncharacterized protein LOC133742181 [Rosa rugosa]